MSRYTVYDSHDCKVIEGAVPVADFAALAGAWGEPGATGDDEWVADSILPHALGVNFVLGPRAACDRWRAELNLDAPGGPPRPEREAERGNTQGGGENAPAARKTEE